MFEHLDDPMFVFEYLLQRLKPGGLLVFDYIKSEGDRARSSAGPRDATRVPREHPRPHADQIHGRIDALDESVGLCMARKKAA